MVALEEHKATIDGTSKEAYDKTLSKVEEKKKEVKKWVQVLKQFEKFMTL